MTGKRTLDFDLSGIGLRIHDLPAGLAERLGREWRPFRCAGLRDPFLEARVVIDEAWRPASEPPPPYLTVRQRASGARLELPTAAAEVAEAGEVAFTLRSGGVDVSSRALQNLIRGALGWRLPSRGGFLVHAACLVLDGRAFLLVGPSDSGKSTWALAGEAGGAIVLSDDLVVIDGKREQLEALGAPFRSTHPTPSPAGRWPLAGLFLPVHGQRPRFEPVGALELRARVLANLPYVAERVEIDARVQAVIERVASEVPARKLVFAPEPSFLPLLRQI